MISSLFGQWNRAKAQSNWGQGPGKDRAKSGLPEPAYMAQPPNITIPQAPEQVGTLQCPG
jgi:hypothetical protein